MDDVFDLARRILDDRLVILGAEFGRAVYRQGGLSKIIIMGATNTRDALPFVWAGGAARSGPHRVKPMTIGKTYRDPVPIRDFVYWELIRKS